jgi:hypothetical protein
LRFLNKDGSPSKHLVVPLFDRCVGFRICRHLDECEPARALRIPIQGDADTEHRSVSLREGVSQLLLRNGVGQVANKQLVAHLLFLSLHTLNCTMPTTTLFRVFNWQPDHDRKVSLARQQFLAQATYSLNEGHRTLVVS